MKKLTFILLLAVALTVVVVLTVSAVSGASFTTFNAHVDGAGKDICKNSAINCNIYGAKEYVWLNGGPTANGLGPDGDYFFAVLEPGGQPNPNDQGGFLGDKNLSDDYDCYQNRIFTVTNGEVSAYAGDAECAYPEGYTPFRHWLDDGDKGPKPNWEPPYIRLFPYSTTTNPGGVYIMAICSLDEGYPVEPRDCKYDAFKVKEEGKMDYSFFLDGYKVEDANFDGDPAGDDGLEGWKIIISGTGPDGLPFYAEVYTDENGYWSWLSDVYTFKGNEKPGDVTVTICEELQSGWIQTFPDTEDGCHTFTFTPGGFDTFDPFYFANVKPEGCTPGFWQGGPDKPDAKAGGALLWDGIDFVPPLDNPAYDYPDPDQQWIDSGAADPPGKNPYIHTTDFNTYFGGGAPGAYTMFELVDTGGGPEPWRQAARDLVAAYLNASWGMTYPYTTDELMSLWTAAIGDDAALQQLHSDLDDANNAYGLPNHCPISAGGLITDGS
jgi:hypothetical protein